MAIFSYLTPPPAEDLPAGEDSVSLFLTHVAWSPDSSILDRDHPFIEASSVAPGPRVTKRTHFGEGCEATRRGRVANVSLSLVGKLIQADKTDIWRAITRPGT
jgi:hypothetical protein